MSVKEKEKISFAQLKKPIKNVIVCLLHLAAGFILGMSEVSDGIKPFGVAFVSVSKKQNIIFSSAGAILGYMTDGLTAQSGGYFAAVVITGIGAFIFDMLDISEKAVGLMCISGASITAADLFVSARAGMLGERLLIIIAQMTACAAFSYFYFKSMNADFRNLRFRALPFDTMVCMMISLSTLLITAGRLNIGIIYPFRALAVGAVLLAARFGGMRWGLILSICTGFMLGAGSGDAFILCGAMSIGVLVCCVFSSFASLGCSLIYTAAIAFLSVVAGEETGLPLFVNSLIGVGIFLLMPSIVCNRLEDFFDSGRNTAPDGTLRQNLVLKLRFASSAMAAVSESVDQVREKINEVSRKNNEAKKDTMSEEEYIRNEIVLEKTNQIRMVASDQFYSISGMLCDLANEFNDAEMFDSEAGEKIRRLLAQYEIYPTDISAIVDKYSRMRVEILLNGESKNLSSTAIQDGIGKICNRYFDSGRITNFKTGTMLSFTEKPNYSLQIGFAQYSAEGKLCGDTVKTLNDGKGHSILIISDGMGKGSRAALDGAMGAGLISRLINAGFGFDSALKIVNSALLIKSNDESLATLDIANIDLFTGKCELFKAGAPSSYIVKNGVLNKCELSSMPAGILRGIEFAKRTAVLSPNDSIIMMSDGITDLGEEWLNRVFAESPYGIQNTADYILKSALKATEGIKRDDMSVIYAKLERNQNERSF